MSVSLDHILMLVGRLDDAPGFDAPRERFRRYLVEEVTDIEVARSLIGEAQHVPGDQHFRALQDLVVLLGRFLGFDVTFGQAHAVTADKIAHGVWQSPSRFHVVVDLRSARPAGPVFDELARSVTALKAALPGSGARVTALAVSPPLSAPRQEIADAVASGVAGARVTPISLGPLVSLGALVSTGRVAHADVVRLFESGIAMDYIVGVLERTARVPLTTAAAGSEALVDAATDVPVAREGSGFWIASVAPDYATTPEEFLELVVAKRHVFGIADEGAVPSVVRTGDSICFYIARKGVVGHARVASLMESGGSLRDARPFRQVLRLDDLELYVGAPLALDPETELRLRRAPVGMGRHAQILVEISKGSFRALTSNVSASDADGASDIPSAEGSSH